MIIHFLVGWFFISNVRLKSFHSSLIRLLKFCKSDKQKEINVYKCTGSNLSPEQPETAIIVQELESMQLSEIHYARAVVISSQRVAVLISAHAASAKDVFLSVEQEKYCLQLNSSLDYVSFS